MLSLSLFIVALMVLRPFVSAVVGTVGAAIETRDFDCSTLALGLSLKDCLHMSAIGMVWQGENMDHPNGNIWIGRDGPNTFTFTNQVDGPVTVVLWSGPTSWVNVHRSKVSYSLPNRGDYFTVSVANGISGAWSAIANRETGLIDGQISNTWGEFTTGEWATVDISREVNMSGMPMSVRVPGGCVSDMNKCVFVCKTGNKCGDYGTYELQDCQTGSQNGAAYGVRHVVHKGVPYDMPEGGCQGWSRGGNLHITLG